ncbi:MAG: bifunctional riboflavin kinase/FAD synthetase [Actinobacteria bacterium]|nr:bifunctional riboflavin kinase/FAD synthetase [Actinomycetota bacterium]MCL5447481.1 bifunctional riboflavin kinase/FAD synthetase [Actinomycetota bacterium]
MKVFRSLEEVKGLGNGSAVTIGVYDGVHLGHRKILDELRVRAGNLGLPSVVITFDPHPAAIVKPDAVPPLICSIEQRLELLAGAGVDVVIVVPFDSEFRNEDASEFIDRVIVDCCHAKSVVVGADFRFGRGREGDTEMLRLLGEKKGYVSTGVPLSYNGAGNKISSSKVRELIAAGNVDGASRLLGRFFEITGYVVPGHHRGGPLLGFPTANLQVDRHLAVPADGVYACWYLRSHPGDGSSMRGKVLPAAVSIGANSTFSNEDSLSIEAHLLDFRGDLYGEGASVRFVERIRSQERYPSHDALKSQISKDIGEVRKVLHVQEPA